MRGLTPSWLPALALLLGCCGVEDPGTSRSGSLDAQLGVLTLDLRPPEAFAAGHRAGAVNLQWGFQQFRLRLERLVPPGTELLLVGDQERELEQAEAVAMDLGYGQVRTEVTGAADREVVWRTLPSAELAQRLEQDELTVLDVRTAEEYAAGHIPGALFFYPDDVARLTGSLQPGQEFAVICAGGWRSSLVASWLERHGFAAVHNVIGGMSEWQRAGLPVETAADQVDFR